MKMMQRSDESAISEPIKFLCIFSRVGLTLSIECVETKFFMPNDLANTG